MRVSTLVSRCPITCQWSEVSSLDRKKKPPTANHQPERAPQFVALPRATSHSKPIPITTAFGGPRSRHTRSALVAGDAGKKEKVLDKGLIWCLPRAVVHCWCAGNLLGAAPLLRPATLLYEYWPDARAARATRKISATVTKVRERPRSPQASNASHLYLLVNLASRSSFYFCLLLLLPF